MCACKQGTCFGHCPCGCRHTPPLWADYRRDSRGFVGSPDSKNHSSSAVPVLVLDPENAEQMEALASALPAEWNLDQDEMTWHESVDQVRAAVRSLLAPPKPEEPTGLGAVVEDARGSLWVLYTHPDSTAPWVCEGSSCDYEDIAAVRVLSEGVTS